MQLLAATTRTQGRRAGDFDFCVPGELVWVQHPCARGDDCGCARAFSGLNSHRSTTTVEVIDAPLTEPELVEAVRASLVHGGWPATWAPDVARECRALGGYWKIGTVLERDGLVIGPRGAVV